MAVCGLLFAEGVKSVLDMAVRGIFIFAGAFLLMGFNLFASGFFTALNDGKSVRGKRRSDEIHR